MLTTHTRLCLDNATHSGKSEHAEVCVPCMLSINDKQHNMEQRIEVLEKTMLRLLKDMHGDL